MTATEAHAEAVLPLVSIVCITYNQARFIGEALAGLFSQTYPRLDIVIMDDASTDATADIIAEELAKYPDRHDVRFVHNEWNLGAAGRENLLKGMRLSRGDFILLASGDDVMLPALVDRMVEVWQGQNVSLVTANALYIDDNSRELNRFHHSPGEPFDESFETLARDGGNALCFGAAMGFERRLYDQIPWPSEHLTTCDLMLPFYAYLDKGARFISDPLLRYRVHQQNISVSLELEAAAGPDNLLTRDHDCYVHLAHAFLMEAELDRLNAADPSRFSEIACAMKPLIRVQIGEMARKLVDARIALRKLGVKRLVAAEMH